jgi:hypothetical protein
MHATCTGSLCTGWLAFCVVDWRAGTGVLVWDLLLTGQLQTPACTQNQLTFVVLVVMLVLMLVPVLVAI